MVHDLTLFDCGRIRTARLTAESCARRCHGASVGVPYLRDSPCRDCPVGRENLAAHPVGSFASPNSFRAPGASSHPSRTFEAAWEDAPLSPPTRHVETSCRCPEGLTARGVHHPNCTEYDLVAPPDFGEDDGHNREEEVAHMPRGKPKEKVEWKDRTCRVCGKSYTPRGAAQLYCEACGESRKGQARASHPKRKSRALAVVPPRSLAVAVGSNEAEFVVTRETLGKLRANLEVDIAAVGRVILLLERGEVRV